MKDDLTFHIEALEGFSKVKGLKYDIENGIFDENYLIAPPGS